ncbi:MAG TPA: DUF309 domain-containing protein [Limnochordia bacterium]
MSRARTDGRNAAAMPAALLEFIERFNRGEYWESHEVLEAPWRIHRSDFYQGLILLASAYVHAQRGNAAGIAKQMAKAHRRLAPYRPHYLGIDVDELLCIAERAMQLAAHTTPGTSQAVPSVRLTIRPELVRGDEEELSWAGTPPADEPPRQGRNQK